MFVLIVYFFVGYYRSAERALENPSPLLLDFDVHDLGAHPLQHPLSCNASVLPQPWCFNYVCIL